MDRNRIDEKPMPTATSLTNRRNRLDEKEGGIATMLTKRQCASIIFNIFSKDIKGSARFKLADPFRIDCLKGSVRNTHPCFTKPLLFLYLFFNRCHYDDIR